MKSLKLLLAALALSSALLLPAANAEAKQFRLENASPLRVTVALVMPTNNGWKVRGWWTLAPYSYKTVNYADAGGSQFGYYAFSGKVRWGGKSNAPQVIVVDNAMNHDVRRQPNGKNPHRVQVLMKQGNAVKFTAPQQQQRRQNSGWW